jgi:hypothetical protein
VGWVGNKWFPAWRGDYCSGFFHPPEDGSEPIWELKPTDYEGTLDNDRPRWVMVNGREMPNRLVSRKSGGADCNIISGETPQPNGWGFPSTKYYCASHGIWLVDDDDVLEHFNGNRGILGQWLKSQGKSLPKAEKEKLEVEVPEALAGELRTFLKPVVSANAKFVELWKAGKTGPLIGAVMREAKGKYEGKHIEAVLKEIVGE